MVLIKLRHRDGARIERSGDAVHPFGFGEAAELVVDKSDIQRIIFFERSKQAGLVESRQRIDVKGNAFFLLVFIVSDALRVRDRDKRRYLDFGVPT